MSTKSATIVNCDIDKVSLFILEIPEKVANVNIMSFEVLTGNIFSKHCFCGNYF